MANEEIEIEKRCLHELKNGGKHKYNFEYLLIPKYQRRYNWKEDQINIFLEEINDKENKLKEGFPIFKRKYGSLVEPIYTSYTKEWLSPNIYFGNIVITKTDDDSRDEIVDGQQRLSTFIIAIKLLQFYTHKIKESKYYKKSPQAFECVLDSIDDFLSTKIQFKKQNILATGNNIDSKNLREVMNLKNMDELISKSNSRNRYIKNMLIMKNTLDEKDGNQLLLFAISLFTLEMGVISFEGQERAFEIFEALNSRGLQLSPSDLIKNYVFKTLNKSEHNPENLWNTFLELFEKDAEKLSPNDITSFIRSYLIANQKTYIKRKELFKEIKNRFDSEKTYDLMRGLINVNKRLENLRSGTWTKEEKLEDSEILNLYLKDVPKIYLSLVIYFLMKETEISQTTFRKAMEYLFRQSYIHWTINNFPSKEIDKKIGIIINRIDNLGEDINNWNSIKNIFNEYILSETYKDEEDDNYDVLMKPLNSISFDKRGNLLTLYKLINRYKNDSNEKMVSLKEGNLDLEHILPQNPEKEWYENGDFENIKDARKYMHRIGNTLFIHGKINKTIKNKIYKNKLVNNELISLSDKKLSLNDSDLFKEEMKWAFDNIPKEWNKKHIQKRSEKIVSFLMDNKILDPEDVH